LPGKKTAIPLPFLFVARIIAAPPQDLREPAYRMGLLENSFIFCFFLCVMANPLRPPENLSIPLIV
jgi:hypothetical protein